VRGGNLYIVGGRPGMGKSALAISIGLNAALDGVPVMMASLEMTATDLAERALSAMARKLGHTIPYEEISKGIDLTDAQIRALEEAEAALSRLPFMIDPRAGLTFSQIASAARRYFAKHQEPGVTGLLLVDYLGLIKAGDRYRSNRVQELGETTRGSRQLAKELGVAVCLLAQLNRGVESRDEKRPSLQDLRDSGEIEQDADVVIMTYREEYYLQQINTASLDQDELTEHMEKVQKNTDVLELGILKQRKGRTGWKRPVSYAFGLFMEGNLKGVVTFGSPASHHLQKSACPSDPTMVLELNRLWVCDDMPRNSESNFVSRAMKLLPPRIIVSYADSSVGHVGYVYRAMNFFYAGYTDMERKTPRYDYIPNSGGHTRDAFRGGYSAKVRRKPKNKYWTTTGNRRERRDLAKICGWPKLNWDAIVLPGIIEEAA
jgi:hypothetical protein